MYGHNKAKTSARIEWWILRLQPYDFSVVYKAGASNPADYMSSIRLHQVFQHKKRYLQFLAVNAITKAMCIEEVIKASTDDREIKVSGQHYN